MQLGWSRTQDIEAAEGWTVASPWPAGWIAALAGHVPLVGGARTAARAGHLRGKVDCSLYVIIAGRPCPPPHPAPEVGPSCRLGLQGLTQLWLVTSLGMKGLFEKSLCSRARTAAKAGHLLGGDRLQCRLLLVGAPPLPRLVRSCGIAAWLVTTGFARRDRASLVPYSGGKRTTALLVPAPTLMFAGSTR